MMLDVDLKSMLYETEFSIMSFLPPFLLYISLHISPIQFSPVSSFLVCFLLSVPDIAVGMRLVLEPDPSACEGLVPKLNNIKCT